METRPMRTFRFWTSHNNRDGASWRIRVNHVLAWKMLIAEKLPQCDKALYLDTDILVRSDLSELFATDLGVASVRRAAAQSASARP